MFCTETLMKHIAEELNMDHDKVSLKFFSKAKNALQSLSRQRRSAYFYISTTSWHFRLGS